MPVQNSFAEDVLWKQTLCATLPHVLLYSSVKEVDFERVFRVRAIFSQSRFNNS